MLFGDDAGEALFVVGDVVGGARKHRRERRLLAGDGGDRHDDGDERGEGSHMGKSIIESVMEKIIVTAKFHTGHRQLGYPGKCKFVHGHTWQGKVMVSAEEFPRDDLDMSLEFGDIKDVMRFMDHKMLVTEQDRPFLDSGPVRAGGRGDAERQGPERRERGGVRLRRRRRRDQEAVSRPRRPLHDRSDHPGNREQHLRHREATV